MSREIGSELRKKLHELFFAVVKMLPTDFEPYGQRNRMNADGVIESDCSCNCKHFHVLQEMPLDWGVCTNHQSPRCGLLTFEHQGCPQYERNPNDVSDTI